jgi:hypothetical protein
MRIINNAFKIFKSSGLTCGMFCSVANLRADVSKERIASIIRLTRMGKLVTTLAVNYQSKHAAKKEMLRLPVTANVVPSSPILVTLILDLICSCEM